MDIPRQVVSFLTSRGLKLATAESCTAGYIVAGLFGTGERALPRRGLRYLFADWQDRLSRRA
ncbi:protein of unknown function (plasmid) [Caballeronia sp. S22]